MKASSKERKGFEFREMRQCGVNECLASYTQREEFETLSSSSPLMSCHMCAMD